MPLTSSNPMKEKVFFVNEMDPVFEDKLARILNGWPDEDAEKAEQARSGKRGAHPRVPFGQAIIVIKERLPEKV